MTKPVDNKTVSITRKYSLVNYSTVQYRVE